MEFRQFKKRVEDGWVSVEFEDLVPGDRVQAFESGELIYEFTVATEPMPCDPPGNWSVETTKRGKYEPIQTKT